MVFHWSLSDSHYPWIIIMKAIAHWLCFKMWQTHALTSCLTKHKIFWVFLFFPLAIKLSTELQLWDISLLFYSISYYSISVFYYLFDFFFNFVFYYSIISHITSSPSRQRYLRRMYACMHLMLRIFGLVWFLCLMAYQPL